MVEVGVRDEDRVDLLEMPSFDGRDDPPDRSHAVTQDRVGQDAHAVHLDEDGGMAEEREVRVQRADVRR